MEPLGSGIHCISLLSSIQQHALKVSQICSNANELHQQTSSVAEGSTISRGSMRSRVICELTLPDLELKASHIYKQGQMYNVFQCVATSEIHSMSLNKNYFCLASLYHHLLLR